MHANERSLCPRAASMQGPRPRRTRRPAAKDSGRSLVQTGVTLLSALQAGTVHQAVLARARAGDPDAFVTIVRQYEPGLRSLVTRLLSEPDRVADVLQETFLRAFRALPEFRGDASLGTWLYRIAYNACLDELRRPRLRLVPLDQADGRAGEFDDPAAWAERNALLRAALMALPLEERAAVLLVDVEGFDYAGAGEVLGVPAGTIASRLSRARGALRRAMADSTEGVEAP